MNNFFKISFVRLFFALLLIGQFSCSSEDDGFSISSNEDTAIPNELTYYQITIQGTTWGSFQREACLFVGPGVRNASSFGNGPNAREVGIVSGSPAARQERGAMWLFTNSKTCGQAATGCNSTIRNAALDIAYVTVSERNRRISIRLDGQLYNNTAAGAILNTNFFNHFTANSGLTASIYRIVTGEMELTFSEDGRSVSGTIDMRGNNFAGSGTAPYVARFSGRRASLSAASCR